MIDLADYREELLNHCSTITALELQEVLQRRGYDIELRDRSPDEPLEDDSSERMILPAPSCHVEDGYWISQTDSLIWQPALALVHKVFIGSDPGIGFGHGKSFLVDCKNYLLTDHAPSTWLLNGMTQEVVSFAPEMNSIAANSSELALAA